ncbi:hypothetical protein [Paracidobacterium acidisoli]|uniref:DUF3352 domain-containing protein n=1 Tax=Paracidobacterium acidisoli TaxID=2303751 RepID=A0A372IM30_9BACT|nr:hypothetical protein [Paracidobacterium acidisoli]MBT9332561.1 hypothetical protein [Paracidobacterium acidisoli]
MHRRTRITIAVVIVVLLLLAGAIYLRRIAPPEAARLLPESEGIVYLNLRPLRARTHFEQHPVAHSPDYQRFIDATGIVFERDIDEAAFALHRMPNPKGPNGAVAFSEVFVGHFDGRRLMKWLSSAAASQETYAGHTIYSIPSDSRTVRVAVIGYDIVAASNAPTAEQIHSMLDRYRTAALPFSGSSLLAEHYSDVPLLSFAWGIGQIALPLSDNGGVSVLGMRLPLAADSTFIASLSWVGRIHLRIEDIAPSDAAAAGAAQALQAILSFVRAADSTATGSLGDPDVRAMLASAQIVHRKNRAVLTATLPADLIGKLISNPQQPDLPTAQDTTTK